MWKLGSFWFYLLNIVFDVSIVGASSYRLLKHARGPTGFARTSALLFNNGLHFCSLVTVNNVGMFIVSRQSFSRSSSCFALIQTCTQVIINKSFGLPNMLPLSNALSVICGMREWPGLHQVEHSQRLTSLEFSQQKC